MQHNYPTGTEGKNRLEQMAAEIRKEGKGKDYDVVIGVSGGCDSSFMITLAKILACAPLQHIMIIPGIQKLLLKISRMYLKNCMLICLPM